MNFQGTMLAVSVDPGHRHAWKREPYRSAFKAMAEALFAKDLMVVVNDGVEKILVTPSDEVVVSKHTQNPVCNIRKEGSGALVRWHVDVEPDDRVA
jgi:hypothetical protein